MKRIIKDLKINKVTVISEGDKGIESSSEQVGKIIGIYRIEDNIYMEIEGDDILSQINKGSILVEMEGTLEYENLKGKKVEITKDIELSGVYKAKVGDKGIIVADLGICDITSKDKFHLVIIDWLYCPDPRFQKMHCEYPLDFYKLVEEG